MNELEVRAALARFDEANGRDPRRELADGVEQPRELVYGRRMSSMLARFQPDATPALRLAARAQHLCRWLLPRRSFAEGRLGYLEWRRACAALHARLAGEILEALSAPASVRERVAALLEKRDLGVDAEAQSLEDVACLVFLESYLESFVPGRRPEQVDRILTRTWKKMSERARAFSGGLALGAEASLAVHRALAVEEEVAP